jgi:excisionase family DNA binding protein
MNQRKTDAPTLTTEEAAELLQVNPRTVRRMIKRGSLEAKKMDPNAKSVYRIPRAAIEKILAARTTPTDPSQ